MRRQSADLRPGLLKRESNIEAVYDRTMTLSRDDYRLAGSLGVNPAGFLWKGRCRPQLGQIRNQGRVEMISVLVADTSPIQKGRLWSDHHRNGAIPRQRRDDLPLE